jgi:hypothetical protein
MMFFDGLVVILAAWALGIVGPDSWHAAKSSWWRWRRDRD